MSQNPWVSMASQAPAPSEAGTKRDFGNMLNEKLTKKKKSPKNRTHWELPQKLKLTF